MHVKGEQSHKKGKGEIKVESAVGFLRRIKIEGV